jgi:hypothetical protein
MRLRDGDVDLRTSSTVRSWCPAVGRSADGARKGFQRQLIRNVVVRPCGAKTLPRLTNTPKRFTSPPSNGTRGSSVPFMIMTEEVPCPAGLHLKFSRVEQGELWLIPSRRHGKAKEDHGECSSPLQHFVGCT